MPRKNLLDFLSEGERSSLLEQLVDDERDDPAHRAELLAGLDQEARERISSDIAESVLDTKDPSALTTILRGGNLQAVEMVADLVLNREESSELYGIGLDCDDNVKAGVIEELGAIIKDLSASADPEDIAIMVEISKATSTFVANLDPEKNEALTEALEELAKLGKSSVLNTLDTLAELIKPGSTTKPEAKGE